MFEKNYLWRIYWQLAGVIMVCVVIALAAVSYFSHRVFDRELVPETEKKAATEGTSVRSLVLKATSYGIPFDSLYGVEKEFEEVFSENPEFSFAGITNTEGTLLYQFGKEPPGALMHFHNPALLATMRDSTVPWQVARVGPQYIVSLPIIAGPKPLGVMHIGIDAVFVDHVLLEVMLDVLVVLVVSLFFTLELLNFMAGARLASGLGEFAQQVERIRAGDFTASARIRANDEIGRLMRRIDTAVDHLNVRYQSLVGELEERLRGTSETNRAALRPASAALEALGK
ncbi:MAG TPA: HAMP domain-containing protein, partial [Usitatibacter sp.]|nr:HAMP domain-containing protein [Usitatibacter sp.]